MLKSALIIYDLKAQKKSVILCQVLQQLNRLKKRACGSMEKGMTVRARDTVRGDQVQHNSIMFPNKNAIRGSSGSWRIVAGVVSLQVRGKACISRDVPNQKAIITLPHIF